MPKMTFYMWLLYQLWLSSPNSLSWLECPKGCDCQGVFKFVNCSCAFLTIIPSSLPMDTEHFDLSRNNLSVIPQQAFTSLWRLLVLLMSDNHISSVEGGAFSSLESLLKLDLSKNCIVALGNGFSKGLNSLKELILSGNKLKTLSSASFLHLESLQKLTVNNNSVSFIENGALRSMTRLRRLYLQHNNLVVLSNGVFSTLQQLEVLNLEGNQINSIDVEVFSSLTRLTLLNLAKNYLQSVKYKTFLSIHTFGTHILLADNPWQCDCDLQRVFRKLLSVQRLVFDDYVNLTCKEPAVLNGCKLADVNNRLCIGETVTVLIITFTVLVTVVAAIVMAERNRKKRTGKHWSEECDLSYDSQD
ncbi:platelet glycoprotein V [Erpetoichthys calabaricus]|uniref:platelet glycoprotein V n=1 Tax=Erpetoichthys calabaricus TaxID=27687 RepID=UPI002234D2C4|nr:platelet glycoprotein V [Erpetoichthys calabaricus]